MKMSSLATPVKRFFARLSGCPLEVARTESISLIVKYDRENDLLLARFGAPVEADTIIAEPSVAVRISRETGQPIAIEITDCAAKFHKDPSAITPAFARELLARYGREAKIRVATANQPRTVLA